MNRRVAVAVCGGGNIAHALVARIGADPSFEVRLLTRKPELWKQRVEIQDAGGNRSFGFLSKTSSDPAKIIPGCMVIVLAIPSYAREEMLRSIAPWIDPGAYLGSFPAIGGFDWQASAVEELSEKRIVIFGTQRVPCIARTIEYGSSVMGDYKPEIFIATKPGGRGGEIAPLLESALKQKVSELRHFLEITLATSNPILHPARMYSIFSDYRPGDLWPEPVLFYEEWSDRATEVLLEMDHEVHDVIARIPCDLRGILPLTEHYGVADGAALTRKIRSIPSFRGIRTPMKKEIVGWGPDFDSRYFTEDIPYGLVIVKAVAEICAVSTPGIDRVLLWAQTHMEKEYLIAGGLEGRDLAGLPLPGNHSICTVEALASEK